MTDREAILRFVVAMSVLHFWPVTGTVVADMLPGAEPEVVETLQRIHDTSTGAKMLLASVQQLAFDRFQINPQDLTRIAEREVAHA